MDRTVAEVDSDLEKAMKRLDAVEQRIETQSSQIATLNKLGRIDI
jgi:tetrahydromethanopterin S-methyltransferase subunit G